MFFRFVVCEDLNRGHVLRLSPLREAMSRCEPQFKPVGPPYPYPERQLRSFSGAPRSNALTPLRTAPARPDGRQQARLSSAKHGESLPPRLALTASGLV